MFSLPVHSYSCNAIQSISQPPKFSREFKTIHNDFKEVEAKIDETRHSIEKQQPRQVIEEKLDKLDIQMHKVHPEVTEITEEKYLSPADKNLLTVESKILTNKLNTLVQKLPDQKLRGKAVHLTEAQKVFHALMNFEFKFGRARNPEKNDENGFNNYFRNYVNETFRTMEEAKRSRENEEVKHLTEVVKFHKTGLRLKASKPATGLAY